MSPTFSISAEICKGIAKGIAKTNHTPSGLKISRRTACNPNKEVEASNTIYYTVLVVEAVWTLCN